MHPLQVILLIKTELLKKAVIELVSFSMILSRIWHEKRNHYTSCHNAALVFVGAFSLDTNHSCFSSNLSEGLLSNLGRAM